MSDKNNLRDDLLINGILILSSFFIFIFVFELILRISPLSDNLGWNRVPPFSKRVQEFDLNAKIKIVALGDSSVEWKSGTGANMFDQMQKLLSDKGIAILNLGKRGAAIDQYIAIYKKYVRFKPDCIIMCVFLGDDIVTYPPYSTLNNITASDWSVMPEQEKGSFLKRHSILANLILRFVKERTRFMRSGIFEKNITVLQKEFNSSDAYIRRRISQIDPTIVELARSDNINPWVLAYGVAYPDYYKNLFSLRSQDSVTAADSAVTLIRGFYREQGVKNFLIVLLPERLQVSADYDYFYKKCGFNLKDFPLQERRKLTEYFETRLNEQGIKTLDVTSALESESDICINSDTHLNKKGHRIVAGAVSDFIKNNFLFYK